MSGPGNNREITTGGDARTGERTTLATDPLANDRYQYWGPSGAAAENNAGRNPTVGAANERLQYDNPQLMTLSAGDQSKITTMWAQANGADINDANAYTKTSLTDGGNTVGIGPFKLTAAEVMNDWANGMVNSQGIIDHGALDNYVQQGKISEQTADMVSTPEFMDFMKRLSTGAQVSPDEIAKYMPPDLQKAIAGDLVNASAAIVGMQGGKLTSGNVLDTVRGFDAQAGQMIDFTTPDYGADANYVPQDTRPGTTTGPQQNYDQYGNPNQANANGDGSTYDPDPDHIADSIPEISPLQWVQMEYGEDPNLLDGDGTGIPAPLPSN